MVDTSSQSDLQLSAMESPFTDATVLVLGSGVTALGVLRAFGRLGIPTLSNAAPGDMATRSRWYRPLGVPFSPSECPADLIETLRRKVGGKVVLFPCSDHWTEKVSVLSEQKDNSFSCSVPSSKTLTLLVDKAGFAEFLQRHEIPHPRSILLHSEKDIAALGEHDFTNTFLKPCDSQAFFARFHKKAFRVATREEALERYRMIREAGLEVILQEYVPGGADDHYFVDGFVDRHGVPRAFFARRRLRIYPPDFGNSSFMVSIEPTMVQGAIDSLRRLLKECRYRGIFSAEFKQDARDGSFRILEVNTRAWWYVDFACRNGVDVCEMAFRDALNFDVPEVTRYRVGSYCMYPYYDFCSVREEHSDRRISLIHWIADLLRSQQPVFSWDDPVPAIIEVGQLVFGKLRRLGKRGT